jgi:WD40 repeat protein
LCAALVALPIAAFVVGMRRGDRPPPSFHRLTFRRGAIVSGRFASDGQTVVYGAAWQGDRCRLFSTRLGSPASRALEVPEGTILAISAADEMALALHAPTDLFPTGTLARAHLAGGAPREVIENVVGADWSPDGNDLAVGHTVDARIRLEFPIGHTLIEDNNAYGMRISPKGDLLAFVHADALGGSVCVVDRRGVKRVLATERTLSGLAWSAAGDEIWFTASQRFDNPSLYGVSLSGKRRLIASFPGAANIEDISREGRVLLRMFEYQKAVFGLPPGESVERDLSWLDTSRAMDLSADGRLLLFHESGQGGGRTGAVYLRRTDGASPAVRLGEGLALALSPDGKWALTLRADSPSDLFLLPTGPGEPRVLHGGSLLYTNQGMWFPDGRRVLVTAQEPGHADRSYVQSIDGPPRPITPEGTVAAAVSPDGRVVAALDPARRIVFYPVDGGEPRTSLGPAEPGELGRFGPDGRWLYATEFDGRVARIYRRDVASGRREPWKELKPADPAGVDLIEPIMTPDGASYVYTVHRILSSLYAVEGLR